MVIIFGFAFNCNNLFNIVILILSEMIAKIGPIICNKESNFFTIDKIGISPGSLHADTIPCIKSLSFSLLYYTTTQKVDISLNPFVPPATGVLIICWLITNSEELPPSKLAAL